MRSFRLLAMTALLLAAAPSFATSFSVLGWTTGESIGITFAGVKQSVTTAQFHDVLDGVAGNSFCVDLSQYLNKGTFSEFVEYDPSAGEHQAFAGGATPRHFVLAAQIADAWSNRLGWLQTQLHVTPVQVITGLQAAIWEAVYTNKFTATKMSTGAQSVFSYVLGRHYTGYGDTTLLYSRLRQDQLFTAPVPEPSALLAFGVGALLVGGALVRRRRAA